MPKTTGSNPGMPLAGGLSLSHNNSHLGKG